MKKYLSDIEIQKAKEQGIRFYNTQAEQEAAYLQDALKRTDEEKFLYLTNLMKIQLVMKNAKPVAVK